MNGPEFGSKFGSNFGLFATLPQSAKLELNSRSQLHDDLSQTDRLGEWIIEYVFRGRAEQRLCLENI